VLGSLLVILVPLNARQTPPESSRSHDRATGHRETSRSPAAWHPSSTGIRPSPWTSPGEGSSKRCFSAMVSWRDGSGRLPMGTGQWATRRWSIGIPRPRGFLPPLEALTDPSSLPEGVWVPREDRPRRSSAPVPDPLPSGSPLPVHRCRPSSSRSGPVSASPGNDRPFPQPGGLEPLDYGLPIGLGSYSRLSSRVDLCRGHI
jgi:hypothetical protein